MCTCIVSPEDKANLELYYTSQDIHDLTYSGLDPMCSLAFLSVVQNGKWEIVILLTHLQVDAIKYGLRVSNKWLSVDFYSKVDTFMF